METIAMPLPLGWRIRQALAYFAVRLLHPEKETVAADRAGKLAE